MTTLVSRPQRWQGPALWFYNDAQFSEHDWAGIQALSQGAKRENAETTTHRIIYVTKIVLKKFR